MKDANQPTFVGRVKYIRFILSRVFGCHFRRRRRRGSAIEISTQIIIYVSPPRSRHG